MKIRTDFVTNSSSSSFILQFDNDEQEKKIHEMYYNRFNYRDEYTEWYQKKYGRTIKDNPNSIPEFIAEIDGKTYSYVDLSLDKILLWKSVYKNGPFVEAAKLFGLPANNLKLRAGKTEVECKSYCDYNDPMKVRPSVLKVNAVFERGAWSPAIAVFFDGDDAYAILKDRENEFVHYLNEWKKKSDKDWTYNSLVGFLFDKRRVNPEYEALPGKLADFDPYFEEEWAIKKLEDLKVEAATSMDNFDLPTYLEFCYEKLGYGNPKMGPLSEDHRIYDEDYQNLENWS